LATNPGTNTASDYLPTYIVHVETWWVEQHHAVPLDPISDQYQSTQKISLQPARVREGGTLNSRAAGRWNQTPARSEI
jgi:hypothetical protein